jgi:hypothetical protein
MRICDFERAVDALGTGVVLDEMKLRGRGVCLCIGHTDTKHLEWDEFGRAYGRELVDEGEEGYEIDRMPDFDLKFE